MDREYVDYLKQLTKYNSKKIYLKTIFLYIVSFIILIASISLTPPAYWKVAVSIALTILIFIDNKCKFIAVDEIYSNFYPYKFYERNIMQTISDLVVRIFKEIVCLMLYGIPVIGLIIENKIRKGLILGYIYEKGYISGLIESFGINNVSKASYDLKNDTLGTILRVLLRFIISLMIYLILAVGVNKIFTIYYRIFSISVVTISILVIIKLLYQPYANYLEVINTISAADNTLYDNLTKEEFGYLEFMNQMSLMDKEYYIPAMYKGVEVYWYPRYQAYYNPKSGKWVERRTYLYE